MPLTAQRAEVLANPPPRVTGMQEEPLNAAAGAAKQRSGRRIGTKEEDFILFHRDGNAAVQSFHQYLH